MSYLKERIKHAVRFRHKRGFGVHSPFMFHLILNVIRDKEKRFTYPERLEKRKELKTREKKVFRLLSRLIRHFKVNRICCLGLHAQLLSNYLEQSYPMATFRSNSAADLGEADFVYIGRKADDFFPEEQIKKALETHDIKYIIIADIHKNSLNARLWRCYREYATVAVDMMWCGLFVFDDKVQPGRYNLII